MVRQVVAKTLTQKETGAILGLADRQIRRLRQRVKAEGDQGLVHRGRGKPSNRRLPEKRKKQVLALYEERYGDFGPTLAVEKLAEWGGITLSAETLQGGHRYPAVNLVISRQDVPLQRAPFRGPIGLWSNSVCCEDSIGKGLTLQAYDS